MSRETDRIIEQQVRRWALEQKAMMEREAGERWDREAGMPRPIITVCRRLGSGGTELAEMVASRLDYQLFDQQVLDMVAEETGVQRQILEALDDHTKGGIENWVNGVLHNRLVTPAEYVHALGKALISIARTGSAVIVGRGANFILAGEPGFHVRATAPTDHCVNRVMRVQGVDREEARRMVERVDRDRGEFVQDYLHRSIDDPTAYHLTLNLGAVGLSPAVDTVVQLYRDLYNRH